MTTGRASPRDLSFVGRTLACLPKVKAKLTGRASALLQQLEARLDLCADVRGPLEPALVDDCPLTARDGGFIRAGYRADLDELRELMAGGKQWIAKYQAAECERTGIPNIKVGFNRSSATTSKSRTRTARRCRPTTSASRRSRTPSGTSRPS